MASFEMKDGKRVLKSRTQVPAIARDTTKAVPDKPVEKPVSQPPPDKPASRKESK